MAKETKNKKPLTKVSKADQKIQLYLVALPALTFLAKLITMANTPGGGWLGADGENYFKGVDGLYADGLFSKAEILNYWPAGYPILLWLLILFSISKFVYIISFIQSLFFAYATHYLTRNLSRTSLAWLALPASLFISLNPTLSLSTLVVGYEAPVAACFMMLLGVVISSKSKNDNSQLRYAFYAGAWVALASFMQPRYLLAGLVIFIIWGLSFSSGKLGLTVASIAISVMLISPVALIARNVVAIDKASISTNLGVTMSIGAGDETRGGYTRTGPEVPCSPIPPATSITDNQLVVCVLKWYVSNPTKTIELAFFKTTFFWSPWSGPLENGTMARNPWLKVAPTVNIAKTQSGAEFLNGAVAKLISWGWILGQLALLFYGYLILFNGGEVSRVVANSTLSAIVISWLISVGTIGDHRFRIPTMGLSLLLQVAAIWKLKSVVSKAL